LGMDAAVLERALNNAAAKAQLPPETFGDIPAGQEEFVIEEQMKLAAMVWKEKAAAKRN